MLNKNLGMALLFIFCQLSIVAQEKDLLLDLRFDGEKGAKCVDTADPTSLVLLKGEPEPERVPGKFGEALRFSNKSQYVEVRTSKKLAPEKFSFTCWVKPEGIEDYEKRIQGLLLGPRTRIWHSGLAIHLRNGIPSVVMNCGEKRSPRYTAKRGTGFVKPGVWTHLTYSYDGEVLKFYRDGSKVFEKAIEKPIKYSDSSKSWMRVGNCYGSSGYCGELDAVKLYDRALNENEIAKLAGKNFKFTLGPSPANAGQAPKGKFYFEYSPTKKFGPKMLDRCLGFTGKPYDRFLENEEKKAVLRINNLDDKEAVITLKTVLDDCWRKKKLSEKTREIRVPANGAIEETIDLETGEKGCFLLKLQVLQDSQVVYVANRPYAVTVSPDPDFHKKDTPFAHHAHNGVWNNRFTPDLTASAVRLWGASSNWNVIERKPGEFDWEATDYIIDHYRNKGEKIFYVLAYSPPWASTAPKDPNLKAHHIARYPPKDMKFWENFVRKTVQRYKDKVKWWEIWNETDSGYFMGTPEEYLEMLKIAYRVLKEEDPDCLVVGISGTSHWYPFTKKIFSLGGHKYMDVLSAHWYLNNPPEKSRIIPSIKAAKELMRSVGKEMPLWDTESSMKIPLRKPNGEMYDVPTGKKSLPAIRPGRNFGVFGERRGAAYLIRARILATVHGTAKTFQFDQMTSSKGHYNLALVAREAMVKTISDKKFVRRIPLGDDNLHAYLFEGKPNVTVLWAAEGRSDVNFNCDATKVELMDFVGNTSSKNTLKPLTINLNAYPQYIVGCGLKIGPTTPPFELSRPKKVVKGKDLELNLKNSADTEGSFKLDLRDEIMNPLCPTLTLTLAAGESKSVSLAVPANIADGPGFLVATMTDQDKKKHVKSLPVRIESPPTLTKKADNVKIDGDLGDWAGSVKCKINQPEQVKIGIKNEDFIGLDGWDGLEDLSGLFSMRWTPEGLYLAAQITDDHIFPSANPKTPFRGDCLELFFDLRDGDDLGKSQFTKGVVQAFVMPPTAEGEVKCTVNTTTNFAGTEAALAGIKAAGKRGLNGYVVEVFFPAALFGVEKLEKDRIIGFDLSIDDADPKQNKGKRKTQMVYRGSKSNHRDASGYGTFKLIEE